MCICFAERGFKLNWIRFNVLNVKLNFSILYTNKHDSYN